MVSDRFELARNFCNKLWNASRFALMNLEGFTPGAAPDADLRVEDRWVLSRLATVTRQVTDLLAEYKYADAARTLYDFAWDEFCSFFVEMVKGRLGDDSSRAVAQRVLAHTLDTLLRLLHPIIPFLTEDVWQRLGESCPERGLPTPSPASASIIVAPWPMPMRPESTPVSSRSSPGFRKCCDWCAIFGHGRTYLRRKRSISRSFAIVPWPNCFSRWSRTS